MSTRIVLLAAFVALAAPANAAPLDDVIPRKLDAAACFTRVYDAAHLKAHSKQNVIAITVLLRYVRAGDKGGMSLGVSLGLVRRGDLDQLYSDGGCAYDAKANVDTSDHVLIKTYPKQAGYVCQTSARPDVFDVLSAEEGGDLILDRGKDRDSLMVYLDEGLAMVKRANRANTISVEFGSDDRIFLLRRTDMKDCAAVKDAVTTPEPAVSPPSR